ncbi:vitrin-like [Mercenaria mercenaria]|uniref:vitrin-like n=1 Tax=Mercenaria mercenaria TaxID=6596 RepID=UPI00234EFB6F|nr:vitrin-like [Mercenaria mercenaria]
MEGIWVIGLLLVASFWSVNGTGSSCQDIDHDACIAMGNQNPKLCSDQILAKTACPKFCKKCPVTCYSCNTTTSDVSNCNTETCAQGEMCVLKTASTAGNADLYSMMCGPQMICSLGRKRNQQYSDVLGLQSRDMSLNLKCCGSDLCNNPQPVPTTTVATTKTTTTTQKPTTTIATTKTTTTISQPTTASSASTPMLTVSQTPVTHHATQQQTSGCKRDIIIILDDSNPMRVFFGAIKAVLTDVISHLDIGPDETRVALGTFSRYGTKQWNLDSHMDKPSLLSAIDHISSHNWAYNANNLVAIELALSSFSQGNRPAVPDDVIFITEGHTYHFFSHNKENIAVHSLHQKSNNVITIAVGVANQNEMHQIATDNSRYLYIQDYAHYNHQTVVSKILSLVCK